MWKRAQDVGLGDSLDGGEGTWRKVNSGWEDPYLELSSHSPGPKQPVGVCLLLHSGSRILCPC